MVLLSQESMDLGEEVGKGKEIDMCTCRVPPPLFFFFFGGGSS